MSVFENNRVFWKILLLWGIWVLVTFSLTNGYYYPERFLKRITPTLIGFIIIIYINVKFLMPILYLQKKHILYFIWSTVVILSIVVVLYHDFFPWSEWFRLPPPFPKNSTDLESIPRNPGVRWMRELTPLIIAYLGSMLIEITRFANKKDKEKLETELKFLKSQINPHFLFNALNNIYSLSVTESKHTPESIMQLSEILRYMVYDSNEPKVPLINEINYIENYVELHLLKDSRGIDVKLDLDKSNAHLLVAPLLFIPFVENAFKHSKIENLKDGFIEISLHSQKQEVTFQVINSLPKNDFTKDKVGGVGLENIRKRLNLLYPDHLHELTIKESADTYKIILKVTLE